MNEPHVFAGNPLDRGERERRDETWITNAVHDPTSKFLPMCNLDVLLVEDTGPALGWLGKDELRHMMITSPPILLGLMHGVAYFAVDVSQAEHALKQVLNKECWRFEDCRTASELLSRPEAGLIAQARAQIYWHKQHRFCSVCGHLTSARRGGQLLECTRCEIQHFPRTDPVVITVVADTENRRCLLGQSHGRLSRMKMYSALAGFMDQGETIEEAVAREVMEEAGIEIKGVRYHSSQPWPFPSSLMIGCLAEAITNDISMDNEEMADVTWFERKEVILALEGKSKKLTVPGHIAIAHHLIKAWATEERC